jgi:hypothetical protein
MTTPNVGPGTQGNANIWNKLSNEFGLYSVTITLTAATLNDLGAGVLTGYSSGSTTRLLLTAASGGTTINGLDANDVADGFTVLIVNQSTTASLIFTHLNSGSLGANQFSNVSAGSVTILPLGAARCTYVVNKWQFA